MEMPKVIIYLNGEQIRAHYSIQEGIDSCKKGEEILVDAGTFNEAIYIKDKTIILRGIGNPIITAEGLGVSNVITLENANLIISDFQILNASGKRHFGNGILCKDSTMKIKYCRIARNTEKGIYCENSKLEIYYSDIVLNGCDGVYGSKSQVKIVSNKIAENAGDGINLFDSELEAINNVIYRTNTGICCEKTKANIINNTIVRNEFGIHCWDSEVRIENNIVVRNRWGICNSNSEMIISHNCVWENRYVVEKESSDYYECFGGEGSLNEDPQFREELWDDFHLKPTSPCIDAGTNMAQGLPEEDKDRNLRIINNVVDIGAYEFNNEKN